MKRKKTWFFLSMIWILVLGQGAWLSALAQTTEPILRLEVGAHNAGIWDIAIDSSNRILVTGSDDKTVRVWDISGRGELLRILRPPVGEGEEGQIFAVALSPDAKTVACGGRTGSPKKGDACVYLFDRTTGVMIRRIGGLPGWVQHLVYTPDGTFSCGCDRRGRRQSKLVRHKDIPMIAANGGTATYLESKGFPSLRRVLRSPERWDRIVLLAAGSGDRLPNEPDAVALEAFLTRRRKADPDRFSDLSLAVVKLIWRGAYALDLPGSDTPGHFGLAVKDYAHSTAPNRRFPDLLTQRLLKAAMSGAPLPYTILELAALATHCTEREDDATKVERRVRKSAAALLLSGRIGESFDSIVTGASAITLAGSTTRRRRPRAWRTTVQPSPGCGAAPAPRSGAPVLRPPPTARSGSAWAPAHGSPAAGS